MQAASLRCSHPSSKSTKLKWQPSMYKMGIKPVLKRKDGTKLLGDESIEAAARPSCMQCAMQWDGRAWAPWNGRAVRVSQGRCGSWLGAVDPAGPCAPEPHAGNNLVWMPRVYAESYLTGSCKARKTVMHAYMIVSSFSTSIVRVHLAPTMRMR